MNNARAVILKLLRHHKIYAAVAAALTSAASMILAKDYDRGVESICQALLVFFSGINALGMHAVASSPRDR